ncbi:MAG: HD domain-containing protein [Thermoanaerobaculia bacterium]
MLTLRDPIHGFIETDALEAALVDSRPLQRLRFIHQLGLTFLVYPGAEHSRFSHVLGAMALAGRMVDALLAKSPDLLAPEERRRARRLARLAALFHDAGHAPFSHSAEELFEGGIDHEAMTGRLLVSDEIQALFARHGDGIRPADVAALLAGEVPPERRFLAQVISGELDVDKMDYLLRDSLYCGVRYGVYDLDRLLDTLALVTDPETGALAIGVEEGGVHAIEALVLARYYMFTQVYFNVTGKALEQHLSEWMRAEGRQWPSDPERFLRQDDLSTLEAMRASENLHARAVVHRRHFPLAFETREHLSETEGDAFEALLPALKAHYGPGEILVARSAKDPHRLGGSPVWVRYRDGHLESMENASHFIRHLTRIDRYRVYTRPEICVAVAAELQRQFLS